MTLLDYLPPYLRYLGVGRLLRGWWFLRVLCVVHTACVLCFV